MNMKIATRPHTKQSPQVFDRSPSIDVPSVNKKLSCTIKYGPFFVKGDAPHRWKNDSGLPSQCMKIMMKSPKPLTVRETKSP